MCEPPRSYRHVGREREKHEREERERQTEREREEGRGERERAKEPNKMKPTPHAGLLLLFRDVFKYENATYKEMVLLFENSN